MPEIVVDLGTPKQPFRFPKLPGLGDRSSKIITAAAAALISISLITFTVITIATNNNNFKKEHGISTPTDTLSPTTNTEASVAALPGGGVATGVAGTSGSNAPEVTLTAQPATVQLGGKTRLKWSVTNNPQSCEASDDWSGNRSKSGEEVTPSLTKAQTYLFTITCKTASGTGFATVSVGVTQKVSSGDVATRPKVTFAANPTSTYVGLTSTLTWSVSNNPSSCSASGDWSGQKTASGAEVTKTLSSAKTYSFTLTCSNGAGKEAVTATVKAIEPPPDVPLVTIYSTPIGPVAPGTSVKLTWEATNNPTSCTASGDWSGTKAANGTFTTGALNTIKDYAFTITCGNAAGSTSSTADVSVVPTAPNVSLTVSPGTTTINSPVTISWSATNSPTSCTASGSWSGTKAASGTQSFTPTQAKTYLFNLSCTNAGGTTTQNNIPLVANNPAAPVVSISANPITITKGSNANISWSATNSPTSCTASGSWAGTKAASGTQSTGIISAAGTYTYVLNCLNAGGSGSATTSVTVTDTVASNPPVVTMSVSPTSIGTGGSATISWSATNSPTSCTASGSWSGSKSASGTQSTGAMTTAGTKTFSLSCSNSAGSGSGSATLSVAAVPVVTISVSPTSLTTGPNATATVTWSSTNGATSCTAGGNWSGSKAASGSATVGPITTTGTYTYSLTCSNAAGAGATASATLVATAPTSVYCSGNTPCYGPNDLAQHNTATNCWAYNGNRAMNITSLNNGYHKSRGNLLPSGYTGVCGNVNMAPFIGGSASIPSIGTHNHKSSTKSNTGTIATYLVGYYDAAKP